MKNNQVLKNRAKYRRAHRTRAKISGTAEKPRLSVFRSLKHISVQAIDDIKGRTLLVVSDKSLDGKVKKVDLAAKVGELMGQKMKEKNIMTAIFDKGSYKYHGRVKSLADGIRKAGIKF